MSRKLPLRAAAASDPGRERSNNEDRVLCEPALGIFAVVDGVGGESAGEVAAETAVEVLRARLSRRTTDPAPLVREAIALANRQIYERAAADRKLAGMSCVLTVAVVDGERATVGHVGDSRLYALAPGEIRKVTRDHSPVGAREDAGELSEGEAMRHPRRNEIFRDVGSERHEPDEAGWIDLFEVPLDPGGALLLCSDGLSDMVTAGEILAAVEANAASPPAAVRALIERANAAGGKDNVSAVLVEGDRFAEAVRRRRRAAGPSAAAGQRAPAAQGSPASASRLSGAARARPGLGERLRGAAGRLLVAAIVVAALLATLAYFRVPLARWLSGLSASMGRAGRAEAPLVVGIGDGGFATIGEALAVARPGETIEVAPGEYRERLELRAGIALLSRVPRGAVLLPPSPGSSAPAGPALAPLAAITASGVRGARVSGLKVAGAPGAHWLVGVRLDGAEVVLDAVEVTGAAGAGVEIRGADRSTLRDSYVHHNGGAGIVVAGEAAPRITGNLIAGNGTLPFASTLNAPGVEVRERALPLLAGNRIEGNAGPGVVIPAPERAEEIFRWNAFGALPREQAVRVVAAVPARGATSPAAPGVLPGLAAAVPRVAPAAGRRPAGSPR